MSVIILGDPHIGRSQTLGKVGIGSALNSRVVDQLNLLDWVLERAIDTNSKHIITTGDVFEDVRPAPYLIALLIDWIKKCESNDIHVHIVIGNHDVLRTGNNYTSALDILSSSEIENVSIYRNIETIIIDGVAFTLIPFRDRRALGADTYNEAIEKLRCSLAYEFESIPLTYKKVVIGHLSLEGSIPIGDEIDDISNELMCPLDMFDGFDYVWFGHVHKYQVMKESNPYIAHIGSMDISNYGEQDHKKYIVLFDNSSPDKFTTEEIPTRPLKRLIISVPKDTTDTTKYVIDEINKYSKDLNKAIVKLDVHLSSAELVPINRTEAERALYDLGVHNVSQISESKKLASIRKETDEIMHNTIDVVSAIKMYAASEVPENKKDAFITLAVSIYDQFKLEQK